MYFSISAVAVLELCLFILRCTREQVEMEILFLHAARSFFIAEPLRVGVKVTLYRSYLFMNKIFMCYLVL